MEADDLLDLIGEADDSMIAEAKTYRKNKKNNWIKWTAAAACLCLAVSAVFAIAGKKADNAVISENAAKKELILAHADYPYYESLNDLNNASDYIIRGKVLSKSCEWMSLQSIDEVLNPGGEEDDELSLVTVYDVSVIKSFKGTENDVIKLLTLGGETEDTICKVEGSPDIEIDGEYVFFLQKSALLENGAWMLNDTQSLYSANGVTLSSVSGNGFELSFEQLEPMRELPLEQIEPPIETFGLTINNMDDYNTFADSLLLSDDDFQTFVDVNSYSMNGVCTKDDVRKILKMLDNVIVPESPDFDFVTLVLHPWLEECYILFSNENNQRCSFIINLNTGKTDSLYPSDASDGYLSVDLANQEHLSDALYKYNDEYDLHAVFAKLDEHYVLFRSYDVSDMSECIEILQSFSFTKKIFE